MIIISIFQSLLLIVTSVVQILLYPIDLLIMSLLPSLEIAFSKIADLFNLLEAPIRFFVDASALSSYSLALIFSFLVFKYTLPFQVYFVKLAIKWYKALRV